MMEERQTKRIRKEAVDGSLKQKLRDLPLLCVEAICKFTPTSQLIRLYSTTVPPPGESWNLGLEAALKRRKISISDDPSFDQNAATRTDTLFDSSGAKIATIKHAEAFHRSPLCEFVQSAAVPFRALPSFAVVDSRLRYVISGPPLLRHLPNVTKLTLVDHGNFAKPYPSKTSDDKDYLLPILEDLLPQLESFKLEKGRRGRPKMPNVTIAKLLQGTVVLKRLDVPPLTFGTLMRAASAGSEGSEALWRVLSGLTSLRIRQAVYYGAPRLDVRPLQSLSGCCTQLTHLTVLIKGELKPYLGPLRALVNLTTLGLELTYISTTGMSFGEDEAFHSVVELRLVDAYAAWPSHIKGAVASLFPNVKVAALHYDAFTALFCEKRVWPQLGKLTCFLAYLSRDVFPVARFLASRYLPSLVDLSPIIAKELARDAGTLTAIYQTVHAGPIETLLLRGPMHRDALPRLQAYVDLHAGSITVTAWKDRDLGDQTSVLMDYDPLVFAWGAQFSQYTDVRIVGTKEDGGSFTIRVVHQHSKETNIFD